MTVTEPLGLGLKSLVPRRNVRFGWGWACFLSRPLEQRDSGEFSPEIMLQKPAELFEILGHSQLHARSQIPGSPLSHPLPSPSIILLLGLHLSPLPSSPAIQLLSSPAPSSSPFHLLSSTLFSLTSPYCSPQTAHHSRNEPIILHY